MRPPPRAPKIRLPPAPRGSMGTPRLGDGQQPFDLTNRLTFLPWPTARQARLLAIPHPKARDAFRLGLPLARRSSSVRGRGRLRG